LQPLDAVVKSDVEVPTLYALVVAEANIVTEIGAKSKSQISRCRIESSLSPRI